MIGPVGVSLGIHNAAKEREKKRATEGPVSAIKRE